VHALLLADGDLPAKPDLDAAWPGWDDGVALVVAADGGARGAPGLGRRIDLVVGDGDSLGDAALLELERSGVAVERSPVAKDETDTELAILAALSRGADRITVVGAFGGPRLDHELANVALLAHPALRGTACLLLDARARVRLVDAPGADGGPVQVPLPGAPGSLVSLLPLDRDVAGVTTQGLVYPLRDEALPLGPARGLSNVRSAADAAIAVRHGRLLVVESPATLAP
jgi:thiamine pyrophosphokinase